MWRPRATVCRWVVGHTEDAPFLTVVHLPTREIGGLVLFEPRIPWPEERFLHH